MMDPLRSQVKQLKSQLAQALVRDSLRIGRKLDRLLPPRNRAAVLAEVAKLQTAAEKSTGEAQRRRRAIRKFSYPEILPISSRRDEIIQAIIENQVVVIAGETGSGKTTQIPKMCLQAGLGARGVIGCTQPRRVAAMSISQRIAEELNVDWGQLVGCKMRFTDRTSKKTLIKVMTDGILLSEIQSDGDLSQYSAIILDEAHERSLNIDFLLGYLKQIRERRPDLRIIITSATIDTELFSKAFGGAPIIEVSGRTYPVEVRYAPLDEMMAEEGDFTYIDAAAAAVEDICTSSSKGDILVFMPGEKDIRETVELLEGRELGRVEILMLFGRLTTADQQRIFKRTQRRKIIVATNIAETSITLPGIRFVVDTGLARISRYSPHTRTQRLPVEEISRSSADQRKGRCGRVADGICIRLYSETDYEARPRFTPPEILRSNLAAVILRMIAFNIGDVATFPFIEPPQERAIRAGYQLLQDLGALDARRRLTQVGRQMARLPIDPTPARMLLQAVDEKALAEVLVIASALSIQDPRERPADKQEAADQMHRRFLHKESDFMTLLNIWKAYHDETERLSQRQLRKFCKSHFLSYQRIREWRDLHEQLMFALDDLGELEVNSLPAEYDMIHRSLLTGLISSIATKDSGNHYLAPHNRKVMLFPGSTLFDRKAQKAASKKGQEAKTDRNQARAQGSTPLWILSAEWVETTNLYARTNARIEPEWILSLGEHLIKRSYAEPRWDKKAQRVIVKERAIIYGLEISVKNIDYGKVNPDEATEIFIRNGLVENEIEDNFPFLNHNTRLRQQLEERQTRLRIVSSYALDENIYQFYAQRIQHISSVHDLHRLVKENGGVRSRFLYMKEEDLMENRGADFTRADFPDRVRLADRDIKVIYAYKPGEKEDGATLKVPVEAFGDIQKEHLDWAIPGYLRERIENVLRSLPKEWRVKLMPIGEKADQLSRIMNPKMGGLEDTLRRLLAEEYGVQIPNYVWRNVSSPDHLRPRIEIVDTRNNVVAEGREWDELQASYQGGLKERTERGVGNPRIRFWKKAQEKYERSSLRGWTFDDLPAELEIGRLSGVPVLAYPGLEATEEGVNLKLFKSAEEAARETARGVEDLLENELGRDLGWLQKDLKSLDRLRLLHANLGTMDNLKKQAYRRLRSYILNGDQMPPLRRSIWEKRIRDSRSKIGGLVPAFTDLLETILKKRQEILMCSHPYTGMHDDLNQLLPTNFLLKTPYARLHDMPRYLDAMLLRAERARTNPPKDEEKAKRVAPFAKELQVFDANLLKWKHQRPNIETYRWMLQEFRVSVFAQELGTAMPVSEKKLETFIQSIKNTDTTTEDAHKEGRQG